jgi:hypothetical protein
MDLPRLPETGRQPVFEEAEEGLDRRQPGVAGAGGTAARGFEVVQERQNGGGPEVLELEALTLCRSAANRTSSWKL